MRFEEMLEKRMFDQIWEKYCGYLDLSIDAFLLIQERLLLEQIDRLSKCVIGKKILGQKIPTSVDEFRRYVPLSTYSDYANILNDKVEEGLPVKPAFWIETTWEGGKYAVKRSPVTQEMISAYGAYAVAGMLMATGDKKNDFHFTAGDKMFFGMATLPFFTGLTPYCLDKEIQLDYLPPIDEAIATDFKSRNKKGFELGMRKGLDVLLGVSVILVKIAESFVKMEKKGSGGILKLLKCSPSMVFRILRAAIKHKTSGKPTMPKDIWDIKGIVCGGTDSVAFKEKIELYWGRRPLEIYAGTEIGMTAAESWSKNGMTFYPDVNFVEFIPEEQSQRSIADPSFVPQTMLIHELTVGENYEMVFTNLKGGIFVRYCVGDMVKCIAHRNTADGINLPQFIYLDRISQVIDIAGFTRITETTITEALSKSNLAVVDWVATKIYDMNKQPKLQLWVELAPEYQGNTQDKLNIDKSLSEIDGDYRDLNALLGMDPLEVVWLKSGTFAVCRQNSDIKVNHINPGKVFVAALHKGIQKGN